MADYISRQAAIRIACDDECEDCPDGGCDMYRRLKRLPAADVVSRKCFNRILAENDTMREMLAQIGKKPGDKMDDVRPVGEISDAVDEAIDFLNSVSNEMPYHVYSALFDLIYGICPNCGADMREVKTDD